VATGRAEFARQLREMGFQVSEEETDRVRFAWVVPSGPHMGRELALGFVVAGDFPLTPPSGPHVSVRLFPNRSGGEHPTGGVHDSPFGSDWMYLSRPFLGWQASKQTVKDYMAHVRHLFDTM
jgi:hypothetical protein